ncbi:MAG: hypothetical protein QM820_41185 [Minicystis sp.]
MTGTRLGELAWVGLVGAALGVFAWLAAPARTRPADQPPGDDGVPSGTVAFFAGDACPPGWQLSAKAQGRLVVGVADGMKKIGLQVGNPLADREDRQHNHDYFGNVTLPGKGIAGADGSGSDGAEATTYTVAGTSDPTASGLPFMQMAACEKP